MIIQTRKWSMKANNKRMHLLFLARPKKMLKTSQKIFLQFHPNKPQTMRAKLKVAKLKRKSLKIRI